jgi:helicase
MAISAAFIGINRFSDPTIRDLTGCCRDALALWALFSDTIPNINAHLLLDERATKTEILAALDATLGGAGPDDTVIVSFSGHGTSSHRLVANDTLRSQIDATTIAMDDLAQRFKSSNARAVLCILDCCFSGGAPARVMEGTPATRSPGTPLQDLAGAGRILLSASGENEPALELNRHGLLTRALFEILQGPYDTISLPAIMDEVMKRVRADAARLGHVQTPVLFGYVQGELTLPSLRKGPKFYAAFPETKGARVLGGIAELAVFGLPSPVLNAWREQFPSGLNALQLSAVNDYRILDGKSLLVVAPTSSGKTFVGEMAAAKAIIEQRRAVFLFPYKALVNEKFDQFTRIYGTELGQRVIRCTGDFQDQTSQFVRGKYDLALLTYEMFLNLVLSNPGTLDVIGLVVVDETQFITDPRRGIVVELLLTYLLAQSDRGVTPQVIALSAVIGELNHFDEWLRCDKLVTTIRPVPLVEGVLDRNGTFQHVDTQGNTATVQLLSWGEVVQRREKASAQDIIVPLVSKLLAGNPTERVIVFRNSRGSAEGCAKYLAKDLRLQSALDVIAALPTADPSITSADLRECLQGGTAFHNANLNAEERVIVERAYREKDGKIRVLGATTTVAAGINTPASTVILAENEFFGDDGRPFTVAEYKNMAGRAGRLGYNEEGRSIILADTSFEREQLFRKYVLAQPEPIRSSFDATELDTWVLRLLVQTKKVPRQDAIGLLANTYGGYLENRKHPGWRSATELRLSQLLTQMIALGIVEDENDLIHLTLLGQACGRSTLSFKSSMRLIQLLKNQKQRITAERLLVLIQGLPEADATYTPVMKRGQSENRWPHAVLQSYGMDLAAMLQQHAEDNWAYIARCKRAMVIRSYIAGTPLEQIEKEATTNAFQGKISAGHVRQFADAARFHLRPAYQIAMVLLMTDGPSDAEIDALIKRLEFGLPSDALGLLDLPTRLTRGELLSLFRHGVKSVADVWASPPTTLQQLLGKARASRLASLRPQN